MHRTPYIVHCTHYTVHRTPYIIHRTPYTVHHTPYTVHCTPQSTLSVITTTELNTIVSRDIYLYPGHFITGKLFSCVLSCLISLNNKNTTPAPCVNRYTVHYIMQYIQCMHCTANTYNSRTV